MYEGIAQLPDVSLGKAKISWYEDFQVERSAFDDADQLSELIEGFSSRAPVLPDAPSGWQWRLSDNVVPLELTTSFAPLLTVRLRWRLVPMVKMDEI